MRYVCCECVVRVCLNVCVVCVVLPFVQCPVKQKVLHRWKYQSLPSMNVTARTAIELDCVVSFIIIIVRIMVFFVCTGAG